MSENIGKVVGVNGNLLTVEFDQPVTQNEVGFAALGDEDFVANSRDHNARWRAWLAQELESLGNHGVRVVPSATNFLLVLFEGETSAETVYNRLMDAGYIVRWLPGQGIPQALRMTIGTEEETRGLAAAIRAALAG